MSRRREDQVFERDSSAKDLLGASLISGFREPLSRREVVLEEETQERAGAGVMDPVSKGEEAGEEG